ncbi:hypothetical protein [uncultured Roseibium sp.]|uniref:hypothetical protein n=1 Tax=uncultured Roseibium sp. TaxID=1936171 RepID=UPI00260C612A|nr:hypothetical protein [uncultured Roseibium sp.]
MTRQAGTGADFEAAQKSAQRIRDYWAARGMIVNSQVVEAAPRDPGFSIHYGVRSDMVNGLPVIRLQRGVIR